MLFSLMSVSPVKQMPWRIQEMQSQTKMLLNDIWIVLAFCGEPLEKKDNAAEAQG